jgi:hypothetical protein
MSEWMISYAWIIDDASLLVLIILVLYFVLRKRVLVDCGDGESASAPADLAQARLIAARLGIPVNWLNASAARSAEEDATEPVRTVIAGRHGRFFQCEERVLDGQAVTRVLEVDRLGEPCGEAEEEVELARDLAQVMRQLI